MKTTEVIENLHTLFSLETTNKKYKIIMMFLKMI